MSGEMRKFLGGRLLVLMFSVGASVGPVAGASAVGTPFGGAPTNVVVVSAHADPAQEIVASRVLYFGTRCSSHGLTGSAVRRSLNVLKASAHVDWHLFGNSSDEVKSGTLAQGGADVTSSTIADGDFQGSKHYALRMFLDRFASVLSDPATSNKYDYVVIETDSSRLATEYGQPDRNRDGAADATLEERVARLLLPFYAEKRVIWLLDNGWDYCHGAKTDSYFGYVSQYPSLGLSADIFQYGMLLDGSEGRPYRVNNGVLKNSSKANQYLLVLSDEQWKGLLSVFDPQLYLDIRDGLTDGRLYAGEDGLIAGATVFGTTSRTTTSTVDLYAGHPYENQVWYDDAEKMAAYLANAVRAEIRPGTGVVAFADRIALRGRQSLVAVRVSMATNELASAAGGWLPLMSWEASAPDVCDGSAAAAWASLVPEAGGLDLARTHVDPASGAFAVTLTNVTAEVWLKAEADVVSHPVPSCESDSFTVTPYVQHPTADGMSVVFFTKTPQGATVRCWPADGSGSARTQTTTGEEAANLVPTGHPTDVPVWGTQYRHRARFDGLEAGTTYRYAVTLDDNVFYANAFRTAPGRDTPVRFVAYSDSETTPDASPSREWDVKGRGSRLEYYVSRSTGYAANIRKMTAWNPDLIVIAGDLVARGGVQMFWDEFWRHNAGANARGFGDPAGSTPILAAIGNHDLYDNTAQDAYAYSYGENGERGLRHYLSYFEYEPNGVDYANVTTGEKDSRDMGQLFHRADYGPVTLIFLDTNNGDDSDKTRDTNRSLARNGSSGTRSPDFNEGSLQYRWLERNLADAREKSRFVLVVSHHCPYSVGKHNFANGDNNGSETETLSSQPVRALVPMLHRYGVTAWLCGHDEIQEHSQHLGEETLADGTTRRHVLNVYDLGSAGDGLRGEMKIANAQEVFRAYEHAPDGAHYGHLQVEVKPNARGVWQCTLTPAYSYMRDASGESELRTYRDRIVVNEDGTFAYEQRKGVSLVEGDGSVVVEGDGNVTVSEDVRQIEGVGLTKEKVKIVYSDEISGKSYDISGAFARSETSVTNGTSGTCVSIRLDPGGSVSVGGGDPIPVTPTLTKSGDDVEPLSVGETAKVGVKTIPGLTYRLKRSESVSDVSQGDVVATERAHGTKTRLTDPMKGGRPEKAFYAVEVSE